MNITVDLIIVILISGIALWCGLFGRKQTYAFLLPFALAYSFWIDMGTRWTPAKIVPIILLFSVLVKGTVNLKSLALFRVPLWMFIFICLLSFGLVINYNSISDLQISVSPGLFRTPMIRSFIQSISYIVTLLYYLIPVYALRESRDLNRFFRLYLIASTSLCVYGVYQLVAYYIGLPFRGVMYLPGVEGFGMFSVGGYLIPRLNSLANEPKQLATFLLPSITMLILVKSGVVRTLHGRIYGWLNLILHGFIFIFTFATSGFFAIFLLVPSLIVLIYRWRTAKLWRFMVVSVLLSILALFGVTQISKELSMKEVFSARTVERLDEKRIENFFFEYLHENPQFLFFGMGPGNFNFYLESMGVPVIAETGVQPLNSGLLTLIADAGMLGLIIILGLMMKPVWQVFLTKSFFGSYNVDYMLMATSLAITSLCLMPFVGALSHLFMFTSVTVASLREISQIRYSEII